MASSDSIGILMRIKADTRDAETKIKDFKEGLKDIEAASRSSLGPLQNIAANVGLTAKEFDNMKTQVLGSVAAIGSVVGVATAVGVGLFKLADSAAEYGSRLHDASQQTGVTVETLSALKYAAEQSGSSFESITGSVAKFSELLGEAKEGNDKALATLKEYGVTATETEQALAQAIKTIAEMTDHDKQAAAAKALFRERTAEILPVIQSFDGDLAGLNKRLAEMGLLMSGSDAAAADAFGDQMDDLTRSLHQVGLTIGKELIPVFKDMATDVTSWLQKNQGEVKSWGQTISFAIREASANWQRYKALIEAVGDVVSVNAETMTKDEANARAAARGAIYDRANAFDRGQDPDYPGGLRPDVGEPYLPGGRKTGEFGQGDKEREKAAQEAEKRRKEREAAFQKELADRDKQQQLLLKQAHDQFTELNKEWEKAFLAGEQEKESYRDAALKNIEFYGAKAQQLIDKQRDIQLTGKKGTERDNVILEYKNASSALYRELQQEREDVEKTITDTVKKNADEQVKATEKAEREKLALVKERSETQQKFLENELKQGLITERQYIAASIRERISVLEAEKAVANTENDKLIILEKIKQLRQDEVKAVLDLNEKEQKAHAERIKNWSEYIKKIEEATDARDREQAKQAEADHQDRLNRTVGSGQEISAIGQLHDFFADDGNTAMLAGLETLQSAFEGLAQGIGQVVQAWVLYGSAGQSVRQVTAQILAGIAQQAAVKAIFELAEGFAALALSFFGLPNAGPSATAHFAAAAIYGSIAGIAALAGRAVAGDSFKKQTASSTGKGAGAAAAQGTGGSGSPSGESGHIYSQKYGDDATVLNIGRNTPEQQQQPITIHVDVRSNDSHIVKAVVEDANRNGKIRAMVRDNSGN
jgi:hypothetical protein